MRYYIYAIPSINTKSCLKSNLIAVRNNGKKTLEQAKPGDKFIFYTGKPDFQFIGYGNIKSRCFPDYKTLIWPDEKEKGEVIYPYRSQVEFKKHNTKIKVRDLLNKLSFIKNKDKYGAYFLNVFFEISREDYLFLKQRLDSPSLFKTSPREIGNKLHDEIKKLFLDTGFTIIQSDYNVAGPDIVAKFQDIKIIIQCKKREDRQKDKSYPSIQRLIDEYSRKRQKLRANVAILTISGFRIPRDIDTDKILEKDKVAIWDDSSIDYYKDLSKKIPSAAKYQILSDLMIFARFDKDIKTEAIKVLQKDYSFYVFKTSASFLLKACRVLRHFKVDDSVNYQRILTNSRIKKDIPEFLKKETAFLPNSIICVSRDKLKFDKGKLIIPAHYGSLWIMDGQHRLYAFANIDNFDLLSNYDLLCVVFDGAKIDEYIQGEIFVDINQNAKKVPLALLLEIGYSLGWKNVAVEIINKLRKSAVFNGRIKMYNDKTQKLKTISFATFCTNQATKTLLDSKSSPLFNKISSKLEDKKIELGYYILRRYFEILAKHFSKEWKDPQTFILSTDRGIRSLLQLLKLILEKTNWEFNDKYVNHIVQAFRKAYSMSQLNLKNEKLKGYAGEAGARELMLKWARGINTIIPDFYQKSIGKEELISNIFIKAGEREKAEKLVKEWFNRFNEEVCAGLNYIDISTLKYLQDMLPEKVGKIRIITDIVTDREQFREEVSRMNKHGYNVKIIEIHKLREEGGVKREIAVTHRRWIGDKHFCIHLESDFKKNGIANKDHEKKLYRWEDPETLSQFNEEWFRYCDMQDKTINFYE